MILRGNSTNLSQKKVDEKYEEQVKLEPVSYTSVGAKVSVTGPAAFIEEVNAKCGKAISTLEEWDTSSLPDEKENKLEEVEEDLIDLKSKLPEYSKTLEKSIDAYRDTHYLGSSLISGKVIDTILSRVDSLAKDKYNIGKKRERQQKYLKDEETLYPNEGDITSAIKSYRDIYSHQIDKNPDWDESLIMILGVKQLLHGIIEQDKEKELGIR